MLQCRMADIWWREGNRPRVGSVITRIQLRESDFASLIVRIRFRETELNKKRQWRAFLLGPAGIGQGHMAGVHAVLL